ncbi:conserved Plasmodium protein, unknown function [Plasmodium vinckei vinckei]|uniref:Uncharacterized protein n=1 Tax=Plasmodium vinckei vinckei TaxID=54757 RepID=A0A449BV14_PLAVN|nr:conserved Plasmodium protein, unknown function [Plasmodium vinckei vinckei]VEV57268.1 conserved Plasmodium protein, unknown function [Plasmodium vinckei vinckei]
MYLFKKAKESIVSSLHGDKPSPIIKINYICNCILKITLAICLWLCSLSFLALYLNADIINKSLFQLFSLSSLILSCLSFIILKRKNGTYILAKIKMYPFSFKDLVDVSLLTGVVTISVFDIILCYLYLLVAFAVFVIATCSIYECLDNPYMRDNENISSFSLSFISVLYMGLYVISNGVIFRNLPYNPLEYMGYIIKNIIEDIFSVTKKLTKLIF